MFRDGSALFYTIYENHITSSKHDIKAIILTMAFCKWDICKQHYPSRKHSSS